MDSILDGESEVERRSSNKFRSLVASSSCSSWNLCGEIRMESRAVGSDYHDADRPHPI